MHFNWFHLFRHFLVFCFSDFTFNCESNVGIIFKPNLHLYHNKISSPYSPDSKSPFFRTHAWDYLCWIVGKQQSQNWSWRLDHSSRKVFQLGIQWLLRLSTTISNNPVKPPHTLHKFCAINLHQNSRNLSNDSCSLFLWSAISSGGVKTLINFPWNAVNTWIYWKNLAKNWSQIFNRTMPNWQGKKFIYFLKKINGTSWIGPRIAWILILWKTSVLFRKNKC